MVRCKYTPVVVDAGLSEPNSTENERKKTSALREQLESRARDQQSLKLSSPGESRLRIARLVGVRAGTR